MDRDENPAQKIDAAAPDPHTIDRLLGGAHHDPHSVLGAHPHPDGTVVRVLRPHADEVHVVRVGGDGYPLVRVHDAGLFSGVVPGPPADYRLAVRYDERVDIVDDPYRWMPTLGEVDLHLISEGRHERLWDVLGAHVRTYETPAGAVTGASFAVWAPTAQGVRVTGDFDAWSGWAHPMRALGSTGVWEIFVPGIAAGTRYKYRILGADGRWREKSDPLAFRTEIPPATASVVDVPTHEWNDGEWMAQRPHRQPHAEPMSVYEMHLGSWRPGLGYREIAQQLVDYLDETGFTHVELLPVAEHPFGGSWGYQVTSYYAPTARFGNPDDFRWFVDHLHQHGYGVIVDWVPAHFPRDEWALAKFDGTPLYEHADPRRGEQPDWGTLVFDFGRKEVRNFLVANALYWLDQFHIDGLRVDAVASMLYLDYSRPEGQWLPNIHGGRENLDAVAFLQETNATVYRYFPGVVTIAEESTAWPGVSRPTHLGGLGFGFKWNMGWMHDTLDYAGRDPIYRGYHHNQMTFSLMYAFSENFVLPLSHDEVVHGKGSLWERMPGDAWNKAANLRALLAYMWAHPGKQLLFQGGEFGQEREWSEQRSLDWHLLEDPLHGGIKTLVGDLNRVYRESPALWTRDVSPEGFSWIDANDSAGNVLSFLRNGVDADGKPTVMVCVANFGGNPKPDYRVGLPFAGRWREVLNTDAVSYGGSGWGNLGGVDAEQHVWHGRPASAVLQLPPAGVLWLAPEPFEGAVRRRAAVAEEPAAEAPAPASLDEDTDTLPTPTGPEGPSTPDGTAGSEPDGPAQGTGVPVPTAGADEEPVAPTPAAGGPETDAGETDAAETDAAETDAAEAEPGPTTSPDTAAAVAAGAAALGTDPAAAGQPEPPDSPSEPHPAAEPAASTPSAPVVAPETGAAQPPEADLESGADEAPEVLDRSAEPASSEEGSGSTPEPAHSLDAEPTVHLTTPPGVEPIPQSAATPGASAPETSVPVGGDPPVQATDQTGPALSAAGPSAPALSALSGLAPSGLTTPVPGPSAAGLDDEPAPSAPGGSAGPGSGSSLEEATVHIPPGGFSDEPTTQITPASTAFTEAPTPPQGIPVVRPPADDEALEEESNAPAAQPGEVAGAGAGGPVGAASAPVSSDDREDGPSESAHRSSTTQ